MCIHISGHTRAVKWKYRSSPQSPTRTPSNLLNRLMKPGEPGAWIFSARRLRAAASTRAISSTDSGVDFQTHPPTRPMEVGSPRDRADGMSSATLRRSRCSGGPASAMHATSMSHERAARGDTRDADVSREGPEHRWVRHPCLKRGPAASIYALSMSHQRPASGDPHGERRPPEGPIRRWVRRPCLKRGPPPSMHATSMSQKRAIDGDGCAIHVSTAGAARRILRRACLKRGPSAA